MKYKRQLMVGMLAFTFLTGNPSAFAAEDSIPNSKVGQYINQIQMKSNDKKDDVKVIGSKKDKKARSYKKIS